MTSKRYIEVQTEYGKHKCLIEKDDQKGFIVTVSGLDGAITWGKNIVHAKEMAKEVIELCVESEVKENLKRLKSPKSIYTKTLDRAKV